MASTLLIFVENTNWVLSPGAFTITVKTLEDATSKCATATTQNAMLHGVVSALSSSGQYLDDGAEPLPDAMTSSSLVACSLAGAAVAGAAALNVV